MLLLFLSKNSEISDTILHRMLHIKKPMTGHHVIGFESILFILNARAIIHHMLLDLVFVEAFFSLVHVQLYSEKYDK